VGRHVPAEVEDRDLQQAHPRQIEHIDDPPDPPVAVREGVDALELVVDERHLHERVEIADAVVR
jgi:hypothetical protein